MVEGDAPRSHTCAHNLLIVPPELYLSREVVCKRVAKLLHMVGVETTFTRKVVGKMLFFMIAEVCFCVCGLVEETGETGRFGAPCLPLRVLPTCDACVLVLVPLWLQPRAGWRCGMQ